MLEIRNLKKSFGTRNALDDINISFPECGCIGIIGPNGSGKSTLLDILSGFIQPSSGSILDNTGKVYRTRQLTCLSTRLHQRTVLPETITVREYLTLVIGKPDLKSRAIKNNKLLIQKFEELLG